MLSKHLFRFRKLKYQKICLILLIPHYLIYFPSSHSLYKDTFSDFCSMFCDIKYTTRFQSFRFSCYFLYLYTCFYCCYTFCLLICHVIFIYIRLFEVNYIEFHLFFLHFLIVYKKNYTLLLYLRFFGVFPCWYILYIFLFINIYYILQLKQSQTDPKQLIH
jgi:hypothetical protein